MSHERMQDRLKPDQLQQRIADLHRNTERLEEAHKADERSPAGRTVEVRLHDMQIAIEQLRVAEEELRVQNEELERNRHAAESALARYQELFDLAPDPYITTDDEGTIEEANSAAMSLLNIPVSKIGNVQIANFVPVARRRAFRSGLQRVASGEPPVPGSSDWTISLKPRRGEPIEVAVTVAAVRAQNGERGRIRWLFRDVTARARAESEVRTLNAELEQRVQERTAALEAANWAKAEFLSVMAHELRTPLNAIIGYAELLEMGIPGPVTESQVAHLTRIRSSGQRLIGLISEVLDLGKVEAGQLRVVREECEVSDAVNAALSLVVPQAAARGVQIVNQCTKSAVHRYLGDQSRVEQIVINLLSNAIKFTDDGGQVTIECTVDVRPAAEVRVFDVRHSWLALRVRDTGIGMDHDALQRVFDPFVQVERPLTRTHGGTGLGLTISRRLARLMGGDITAQSVVNKGSAFTLWLPAAVDFDESDDLERRAPARYAQGLAELGTGLLERIDEIVKKYSRKLRAKRGIAKAKNLSRSELEDHAAAFLADIVQALVVVEEAQGGPSGIMRDGSVLRRIISERHGAQRQRLGWTDDELKLEFRILKACVLEAANGVAIDDRMTDAGLARKAAEKLLVQLLDTAEEISIRGFRLAQIEHLDNPYEGK